MVSEAASNGERFGAKPTRHPAACGADLGVFAAIVVMSSSDGAYFLICHARQSAGAPSLGGEAP